MRFVDELAWKGISCRIEPKNGLRVNPCWRIEQYDGLSQEIKDRWNELVEQVRENATLIPTYNFAMVAADLTVKWARNPEQLINAGDGIYIPVTPNCYAWLRLQMSKIKLRFDSGKFDAALYDLLRERFNAVHNWAMTHYGEGTLLEAVQSFDEAVFIPPVATESGHVLFQAHCARCGEPTQVTVRVDDDAYPWQYHCGECGYWARMCSYEVESLNTNTGAAIDDLGVVPNESADDDVQF